MGRNHGFAAGRQCWAVTGTLCPGHSGHRATDFFHCLKCRFFKLVEREEGRDFDRGLR